MRKRLRIYASEQEIWTRLGTYPDTENGVDLRYIQELSGLSRSTTAEIYTHESSNKTGKIRIPPAYLLKKKAAGYGINVQCRLYELFYVELGVGGHLVTPLR